MAITENPYTGAPLYLKDSAWANKFFTGGELYTNAPKRKFLYLCGFIGNYEAMKTVEGGIEAFKGLLTNNYIFQAKTLQPPSYKAETEVLDQYNKRRVIQTRLTSDPVTLTLHDDSDNKILKLIDLYVKFHYGSSFNKGSDWDLDTVKDFINEGSWGFKANIEKYFFKGFWIAWFNAGQLTYAICHNPILSSIDFDMLDYSDSNPLEISLTIEHEGVRFTRINDNINSADDAIKIVYERLAETEELGQFYGIDLSSERQQGLNRSPGLGELFNTGATFFGKYNGKPTIKDALGDFVIRPALGQGSGIINSFGNFNFGGIGESKSSEGLLGPVANTVSEPVRYLQSGSIVTDVFSTSTFSQLSDPRSNSQLLSSTGLSSLFGG